MPVNSALSEWESVISGVPPRKYTWANLFIFYKNDLPTDINAKLLLFADHTKLIKTLLSMMSYRTTETISYHGQKNGNSNWTRRNAKYFVLDRQIPKLIRC